MTTFVELVTTTPYDVMGPAGCANAVNAATTTRYRPLDRAELNQWSTLTLVNAKVKDVYDGNVVPTDQTGSGGPNTEALKAYCIGAWNILRSESGTLDLNDAGQMGLVQGLSAGDDTTTVISDAALASLLAMALETVALLATVTNAPRTCKPGDVIQARAT
jgi:hypothetical protein